MMTTELLPDLAAWGLLVLVLVTAVVGTSIRVVPEHERLVVTRLGRVLRVAGPGLARRVVGLDRWQTVSLRPVHQVLGVSAQTQDGVAVHLRATVHCHVTDPVRAVVAADDPLAATFIEVESHLAHAVAATDFSDLLSARQRFESDLPALVTGPTSAWGVEVFSLDVGDIEVLLTADLVNTVRPDVQSGAGRA